MIERYSLGVTADQLASHFGIDPHGFEKPRFNAAPAQLLPVITMGTAGLSHFYWGTMPQWAKNKAISEKIINVHLEQIADRATLKRSLKKLRCVIPADGFYAWKKVGKKTTIPYRLRMPDKSLFGMAGFWEEFDDEKGEVHHTFTIITCAANASVVDVTDRMPVLMSKATGTKWLDPAATDENELLTVLQADHEVVLENYTISPRINSAQIDEQSLIFPTPPADQFGNLTLFS